MTSSHVGSTFAAAVVVLTTGLFAGFMIFGVCNENSDSRACELTEAREFHIMLGVIPALITIGVGLLLGKTSLYATAISLVCFQAAIVTWVVIAGP